jgi:hypothetical protein
MQQTIMSQLAMIKKYRSYIRDDAKYVEAFEQIMDIYHTNQWRGLLMVTLISGTYLDEVLLAVMLKTGDDKLTELLDSIEDQVGSVPMLGEKWAAAREQVEGYQEELEDYITEANPLAND